MKHNILSSKELGIIILSRFYLFLVILHILSLCAFSTTAYLFGQKITCFSACIATMLFIVFLYFLYDAIKHMRLAGFILALIFQLFFVINNSRIFFGKTPFLDIKGEKAAFPTAEKPIIIVSIIVNILVSSLLIYYLYMFSKKLLKYGGRKFKKSKSSNSK
ncbi:MAG: hypothetical protein PHT53_00570 [Candidatus Omnitrophica bacterium]|nr:hypothetical protein [Candidatus Omnitrophota bacterium]